MQSLVCQEIYPSQQKKNINFLFGAINTLTNLQAKSWIYGNFFWELIMFKDANFQLDTKIIHGKSYFKILSF